MGCQHSKCQVRREERGSGTVRDRKGNFWNWIGRKRRAMVQLVKSSDDGLSAATEPEKAKPARVLTKTSLPSAQRESSKHRAGSQAEANMEKAEKTQQGSNHNVIKESLVSSEVVTEPSQQQIDCVVDSCIQEPTDLNRSKQSTPSTKSTSDSEYFSSTSDDFIPMIPVQEMRGRPDLNEDRHLRAEIVEDLSNAKEQGNHLQHQAEQEVINRRGNDFRVPAELREEWITGDGTWQDGRQDQMEHEKDSRTPDVIPPRAGQGSPETEETRRQEGERHGRPFYQPVMSKDSEESKEAEIQKEIKKKKNAILRESLKEQVDKRQEEIRLREERELKELLKIEKYAKAYREQKQKEKDERKRQENLKKEAGLAAVLDDEDMIQIDNAVMERQRLVKEKRQKMNEHFQMEKEKRLKREKERREEERLVNYMERLRIRRQNEQQQKGKEEMKQESGILEEIERLSQKRQKPEETNQKQTPVRRLSDDMTQRQSIIDESNSEVVNPSTRRTGELTDSIDDLLQRKVKRNHKLPLAQLDQRRSSLDTREDVRTRQPVASTASDHLNNYTIRSFRYSAALRSSTQSLRVPTNSSQAIGSQASSRDISQHQTLTSQNNRPLQSPTTSNQRDKQTRQKGAVGERPPVPTAGRIPESARLFFQRQHHQ